MWLLFPLPHVGVVLGCVCGMEGGLCQSSTPPGPPLWPAAPPPTHTHMCVYLFFSSLFGGVAVAALDASWDLPMDCLSCGGGRTWRGGVWVHVWHGGPC
jgi:hypothetical protein